MLYPEIEPHAHGLLDVGDGNSVYWEECGNPDGKPALVVHGGPGSGCSPQSRRFFDPDAYRVLLLDQRGCGRSTPNVADYETDLSVNTTHHLIADMEKLREHRGVDRWLLFGGSWGSTLILAYAQRFPERVSEAVIGGVTVDPHREVDWMMDGIRLLLPEAWERFRQGAPGDRRLDAEYADLLNDPDPAVRAKAADDWCAWDDALLTLDGDSPTDRWSDPRFRYGFARMVTHYFRHDAWLERGELLDGLPGLAGIPAVLVQGTRDISAPMLSAWLVAKGWPGTELVAVKGAGHTSDEPGNTAALVAATDRFRPHPHG